MIPISISRETKERVESYFSKKALSSLSKKLNGKFTLDALNNCISSDFGISDAKIEDIIVMPFGRLKELHKKHFEPNKNKFKHKGSLTDLWQLVYSAYDDVRDKERNGKKINQNIIEDFNIIVCPYCNMAYVNNRETYAVAQLDHFFPRSVYPIYSLSLYNLVPSCYACNHTRSNNTISASPFDDEIDFKSAIKFSYIPENANFLNGKGNLKIEIIYDDAKTMYANITEMQIDKAYEIHTDYVYEILAKNKIYEKTNIVKLIKSFPDLNLSESELLRMLYGNYIDSKNLGKRPLAKLTQDILVELGVDLS